MNTFERNFGKCFILECAYTLECSKIYGVPKLLALQYLAEPKLFILTNWRFVIGGSLRIIKFMAIYNWRK